MTHEEKPAFDPVTKPAHYQPLDGSDIECIDAIKAQLTPEEFRGYLRGSAAAYVWRAGRKGEAGEDYAKAQWFLQCLQAITSPSEPA